VDDPLRHLSDAERSCLERFLASLREALGGDLEEATLFGSAARGDMWPRRSPFRSDIDVLVVTRRPLDTTEMDEIVGATYPLYLECGRQIAPQFRTRDELERPRDERGQDFAGNVARDGAPLTLPPAT
jgi:predicted nucleotidyltransferase